MSPLKRLVLSIFVTQVLFFIICVSADNPPTPEKLKLPPASKTVSITKNESNFTNVVLGPAIEGGGHANLSLPSNHVDDKNVSSNLPGTEHNINVTSSNQTRNNSAIPEPMTPAVEEKPSEEPEDKGSIRHSTISARKSANSSELKSKGKDDHNDTVNVTNTTTLVKKPTVTIPGEADPSESVLKLNASVKIEVPSNVSDSSTQKYVVPIVIVILSVPFVAIIISILYKRGAEWWRYRHYRRMDFLINGMYDN